MNFSYDNISFQNKAGGFPRIIEAVKNTKKDKNSVVKFDGEKVAFIGAAIYDTAFKNIKGIKVTNHILLY